jgi:PAS domain S-box-containing protein
MREFSRAWLIGSFLYLAESVCYTFLLSAAAVPLPLMFYIINVLCLYTILFIFSACCSIDNIPYKKFWAQYPLLLVTYGLVMYMLELEPLVIALPFFLYEILLIAAADFMIIRRWRLSVRFNAVSALFITGCCFYQMYSCLAVAESGVGITTVGVNVLLLLLLNFFFTYLYQKFLTINQTIREDYLYTLAEKAVDIVFYYTLRPDPRFTFISPSVESIVGYKQNDFYKNPKLYLELTHEEDREIIRKAFSPEANSVNKNFIRWQRSDSEYIYLEFHNTPIFSGDEQVAIEGVLRDITDRKMVEQEMIDSKKSRQLLLSYISHELKTPITYIVGYAEALQKNLFSGEKEREDAIGLIYTKTIFLQNLVEDLFQLSKMESNQFSFEFMQTKVYALCRYIADKHRSDIAATGIGYFCQIDETLKDEKYEVLVDIKRIHQVFANLLNNSIKHTPEGGTISFYCTLDEKKDNIIMKLADTGAGIPEGDLPYIFKSFYRGKNSGSQAVQGSGLGLSLSRQIILAHKGSIEALSAKEKGSIFIVTIPLYKEDKEGRYGK